MANTTPISNALNIRLAQKLDDMPTVGADDGATASTNGSIFTAAQRNLALAQAYNELVTRLIGKYGSQDTPRICEGLVATQEILSFSASGLSIYKDYVKFLRLVKTSGSTYRYDLKSVYDADDVFIVNSGFAIEGGKLYAYERSSGTMTLLSTGTGTLHYLKSDRRDTSTGANVDVNTAPDTTIEPSWLEWCMEYAAWWLAMNKGAGEWQMKAERFWTQCESKLPKQ